MTGSYRRQLKNARLKGALTRSFLLYLPLGILILGMGGWLNTLGKIPRTLTLSLAGGLLLIITTWELYRYRRKTRLPLTPETAQAFDFILGIPEAEPGFRKLHQRLSQPFPSFFSLILLLSLAFSFGLNLGPYLAVVLKPLLGISVVVPLPPPRILVEIETLKIHNPLTGEDLLYTGHDGYIHAPEGATITVVVHPLFLVEDLWIRFASGSSLPLLPGRFPLNLEGGAPPAYPPSSPSFHGSFIAVSSEEYGFSGEREGIVWQEPLLRLIRVEPDLPPEVEWVTFPPSLIGNEAILSFQFRARDDRGIRAVSLEVEGVTSITLPLLSPYDLTDTGAVLAQIPLSLLPPGEKLTLTLLAYDNDRYPGPNPSRSSPHTLNRLSPLEEHLHFLEELKELRKGGVLLLGDLWEKPEASPEDLRNEAERLSYKARKLSRDAGRIPFTSPGAPQKLTHIYTLWQRIARAYPFVPEVKRPTAESAVWETDRLIGKEVLARIEMRSRRIEELMKLLNEALKRGDEKEAEKYLAELMKEYQALNQELREEMREAPPELAQEEGLRRQFSQRRNLEEELLQALRRGDKARVEELLKELQKELEERKRMLEEMRVPLLSSFPGEGELARAWAKILELKGEQSRLLKEIQRSEPRPGSGEGSLQRFAEREEGLERKLQSFREELEGRAEWGEVVEALRRAESHMQEGSQHLRENEYEEGVYALEQGLNQLNEASQALKKIVQEREHARRSLSAERETFVGENLTGELRSPLEPQTHPHASIREEALKGFRKGIPPFGSEINRRYLDRLLH